MNTFENKLVAVLNKSVPEGKVMNALAHMCIGFGAKIGSNSLDLVDYKSKDGQIFPNISKMPFIILRTNNGKIKRLFEDVNHADDIDSAVFTDTMTIGTWQEQIAKSEATAIEDMTFFGIVLYGDWDKVSALTKKFSLWQ